VRILGIDPGTAKLGYAVVAVDGEPVALDYGIVETSSATDMARRLLEVHDSLRALIAEFKPEVMAVEQLFFARNVTTALAVGQARGVAMLAAAQSGMAVVEYTPAQVKQAVAGYGKADKHQIQQMVQVLLALDHPPTPDDAADALAIALCHAQSHAFLDRIAQNE
jgi:crossover junction endodeoxyribonuclease RuvC